MTAKLGCLTAGLLYLTAGWCQEFPAAPATLDDALAAGLRRVVAEEIAARYPGARTLKSAGGEVVRLNLHADGTLDYADDRGVKDTGSWAVLPRSGGTLCRRYSKQMGGRVCVVYFAAPDERHWFGYSAESGQWRDTAGPMQEH